MYYPKCVFEWYCGCIRSGRQTWTFVVGSLIFKKKWSYYRDGKTWFAQSMRENFLYRLSLQHWIISSQWFQISCPLIWFKLNAIISERILLNVLIILGSFLHENWTGHGGDTKSGLLIMYNVCNLNELWWIIAYTRQTNLFVMVIFGASGDLTKRKLMPALYSFV